MVRTEVIQRLIKKYSYKSYLEIGLDTGLNFKQIEVESKESIDPSTGQYSHANPTYRMTSDEFFETYPEKTYDIIFIDGLHHSEQVTKDIANSIKALNKHGAVILHDCSPPDEQSQIVPRVSNCWTGDVWRSLVEFNYNNHTKYTTYVVDTDLGIGVIREGKGKCNYILPKVLEYKWFDENRVNALNLITVDQFTKLL